MQSQPVSAWCHGGCRRVTDKKGHSRKFKSEENISCLDYGDRIPDLSVFKNHQIILVPLTICKL